MIQSIREYLLHVVAAALLASILLALIPNGTIRKIGTTVAGMFLILVCLAPIHSFDVTDIAQIFARLEMENLASQTDISVHSLDLTSELIKQNAEAYILDKAASMGVSITADVTVSKDGAYPYPASVVLCGEVNRQQREMMTEYIEASLAIAAQSQEWIVG